MNPDIFFQCREACNEKISAIPDAVEHYMREVGKLTGRPHRLFDYYGTSDAQRVIVLMGSAAETAKEVVDYLTAQGEKVGLVSVHLYRPFSAKHFLSALPDTVRRLAVLDRTKEPGAVGEPLYQDICAIYKEQGSSVEIVGGRYGLSSKDTTPGQILAVFDNLKQKTPKNNFTIGIVDDVTFTSLPVTREITAPPAGQTNVEIWGMGSDGTVGANKNSIKIISPPRTCIARRTLCMTPKSPAALPSLICGLADNPSALPIWCTPRTLWPATHPPTSISTIW